MFKCTGGFRRHGRHRLNERKELSVRSLPVTLIGRAADCLGASTLDPTVIVVEAALAMVNGTAPLALLAWMESPA